MSFYFNELALRLLTLFEILAFEDPPAMQHSYYKRPKPGSHKEDLSCRTDFTQLGCQEVIPIPRQRSVTFEPMPGSAPGDTEVETDGVDEPLSQESDGAGTLHTPMGIPSNPDHLPDANLRRDEHKYNQQCSGECNQCCTYILNKIQTHVHLLGLNLCVIAGDKCVDKL